MKDIVRQTGEIVVLAVMIGDVLAYLDKEEGPQALHTSSGLGQPIPLHSTASGKAILAHLQDHELFLLLKEKGLPAFTEKTITNFVELKSHLDEVRDRGTLRTIRKLILGPAVWRPRSEIIGGS